MDTSDSTVTASASKEEAGGGVKSEGGEDKMEVEGKTEEKGASKKVTLSAASKAGGGETTGSGGGDKKKSDEPDFQMIANPARVLPQQVRFAVVLIGGSAVMPLRLSNLVHTFRFAIQQTFQSKDLHQRFKSALIMFYKLMFTAWTHVPHGIAVCYVT